MTETGTRAQDKREQLLDAMLPHAAFDGWTDAVMAQAAGEAGLSEGEVELYCPRGVIDVLETWSRRMDAQAEAAIAEADIASMRIRDRVTFCLTARLEAIGHHEEAAHRARARLMAPDLAAEGTRLAWNSCDRIWRAIGDVSTDFNFYTKRAILFGIYTTTLGLWLNDKTEEKETARDYLANRIENVMQYEKAKWQVKNFTDKLPDPTGLLARMRHGWGRRV